MERREWKEKRGRATKEAGEDPDVSVREIKEIVETRGGRLPGSNRTEGGGLDRHMMDSP